ncbi:MAG: GntR family transcriptional regulator [Synergistetes bacterium]|nr:MAG: Transcriptional regulator, GntR family [bacterium 42_11]MBC7330978.1 GntR family transcriptional regulator [Synergistota bacterium]
MEQKNNKTKTQQVYESLRKDIISGVLLPGARIVIREVALKFGVSEIPVREAIKRLEAEGLVINKPYAGAVVAHPSIEELKEIMVIRGVLEALAARISAPNLTQDDLNHLKELLKQMERYKSLGMPWEYSQADREFHLVMYSKCNNKKLMELIKELWNQSERARGVFNIATLSMEKSYEEHRKMLEALINKRYDLLEKEVNSQKIRVSNEIEEFIHKLDYLKTGS